MAEQLRMSINDERDVLMARLRAKKMAANIGFGLIDQTRISTAVSEIVRNVLQHGGGHGEMVIKQLEDPNGVEIIIEDEGTGVRDVGNAMKGGNSTRGGLGLGLSGAKRLMDDFDIDSKNNQGTRIVMKKWG